MERSGQMGDRKGSDAEAKRIGLLRGFIDSENQGHWEPESTES